MIKRLTSCCWCLPPRSSSLAGSPAMTSRLICVIFSGDASCSDWSGSSNESLTVADKREAGLSAVRCVVIFHSYFRFASQFFTNFTHTDISGQSSLQISSISNASYTLPSFSPPFFSVFPPKNSLNLFTQTCNNPFPSSWVLQAKYRYLRCVTPGGHLGDVTPFSNSISAVSLVNRELAGRRKSEIEILSMFSVVDADTPSNGRSS